MAKLARTARIWQFVPIVDDLANLLESVFGQTRIAAFAHGDRNAPETNSAGRNDRRKDSQLGLAKLTQPSASSAASTSSVVSMFV